MSRILGDTQQPFPYWPPHPTERQLHRMELLNDLNKWDNNNPTIAKRCAEAFIELLQKQFCNDMAQGEVSEELKKITK